MGVSHVCLLYEGHTSLILVNNACKYDKLVDLIILEFRFNYAEIALTMTYLLDSTLSPMQNLSNNNSLTYLRLESMYGSLSSYPINDDSITTNPWQSRCSLQCPESSISIVELSAHVFSLQQIASNICDSILTIEEGTFEEYVTLVSYLSANGLL